MSQSSTPHIDKLIEWIKTLPIHANLRIYCNHDRPSEAGGIWEVRIVPAFTHRSIRRHGGNDLEQVAAELLPMAQKNWEQLGHAFIKEEKLLAKSNARKVRRDFAELERMHMGADDF
jgi:hypothetical protein